jgi:hypothetical protein
MPDDSSGTLARRIAVEKQPGCPTCGVVTFLQVLGHGAAELRKSMRSAVRVLVDRLVTRCRGEAEVRRDVDETRLGARSFGRLEQRVDQRGGGPVRRGAEHRGRLFLRDQCGNLRLRLEGGVAERSRQVREGFARELARRTVRHHARQREGGMADDQAQQLA